MSHYFSFFFFLMNFLFLCNFWRLGTLGWSLACWVVEKLHHTLTLRGYNTYREIFYGMASWNKVVEYIAACQMRGILLWCLAEEISARQLATAEQPFCFTPYPSRQIAFKLAAEQKQGCNFCQVGRWGWFLACFSAEKFNHTLTIIESWHHLGKLLSIKSKYLLKK